MLRCNPPPHSRGQAGNCRQPFSVLNATVQGIVTGIVVGLGVFIVTNWLVFKGCEVVGLHLALLDQYFIGYRVTFVGSLIGSAYGFVCGFVGGYFVARMYNWFVGLKEGR